VTRFLALAWILRIYRNFSTALSLVLTLLCIFIVFVYLLASHVYEKRVVEQMRGVIPPLFVETRLDEPVRARLQGIGVIAREETFDASVRFCIYDRSTDSYAEVATGVRSMDVSRARFDSSGSGGSRPGIWISRALADTLGLESIEDATFLSVPRAGVRVPRNCLLDDSDYVPLRIAGFVELYSSQKWLIADPAELARYALGRASLVTTLYTDFSAEQMNEFYADVVRDLYPEQDAVPAVVPWSNRLPLSYRALWHTLEMLFTVTASALVFILLVYASNLLSMVFVELRRGLYLSRFLGASPWMLTAFITLLLLGLIGVLVLLPLAGVVMLENALTVGPDSVMRGATRELLTSIIASLRLNPLPWAGVCLIAATALAAVLWRILWREAYLSRWTQ
jgi:hypothetical protein